MATKYDKSKLLRAYCTGSAFLRILVVFAVFYLSACASTQKKASTDKRQENAPSVISTAEYLPRRSYDKSGEIIPFVASPNPYLLLEGKIKKDAVLKYIEAKKSYKRKQYEQADKLISEVVKLDKRLAGPWVLQGDIAQLKNDSKSAIDAYIKAIAVNPKNVNAYIRLAKLYRLEGQFILAQNTYAQALSVWSDFPEAHLNLAMLYDIYFNESVQAQQHMEAYQFLTGGKDKKVAQWLNEIQSRTGIAPSLFIEQSNTSQIVQHAAENSES